MKILRLPSNILLLIAIALLTTLTFNPSCGGGSSSGGGDGEEGDGTTETSTSAVWTDEDQFGALMVNSTGEMIVGITEEDGSGNVTGLTGAIWMDDDGGSVTVYLGDDGYPTKTVVGDYILMFSNWDTDAQTVDVIKIYSPNDYIELFKGVDVSSASENLVAKLYAANIAMKTTCFPTCETDLKNLAELFKVAGLGLSLGGCAVASTVSLGAAALPCFGLIVATASMTVGSEEWLGNLDTTGNILALPDYFGCATGDVGSCVSVAVDMGGRVFDTADEVINTNDDLVTTGNVFLSNPDSTSGVVQEGTGLPSCTSSYECTPNAYMPCYPEGVKQCSADCTWGICDHDTCGDGTCDPTALESNSSCPGDCPLVCGDGRCNAIDGETAANCSADCSVSSCCVSNNNCPSETPYECPGACCCCGYGQTCNSSSICSAN